MLEKLESKNKELSSMKEKSGSREELGCYTGKSTEAALSSSEREDTRLTTSQSNQAISCEAQAEGSVGDIHSSEKELERLNSLWRRYESFHVEGNTARNRFRRTNSCRGFGSDHKIDTHSYLPYTSAPRNETQKRLIYLRSAFVIYILVLHVLVFTKISF